MTQVGVFVPDGSVPQPPVWLFDQMKGMATNAGDASAWAWWTRTTAEKAALATGNSTAGITEPERPVYLTIILGDFTRWLWALPEGTKAPEYSWIFEVIDPETQQVEATGASAKPSRCRRRRPALGGAEGPRPDVRRGVRRSRDASLSGLTRRARRSLPANFATFSQLWYSGPAAAEEKSLQIGTMPS